MKKPSVSTTSPRRSRLFWPSLAVVAAAVSTASPIRLPVDSTVSAQAAQAPAPAATYQDKFITTSEGRRIHYLDWGTAGKRPFIMLHGINRSGHTFDHIAPLLQRD